MTVLRPPRRIIQLDATHLCVWRSSGGTLVREFSTTTDDTGQASFASYLSKCPTSLFSIVADVAEEDYRQEHLPFVRGADRKPMLSRKVSQLFYGSPYTLIESLGRTRDGREDERFIFAALTRPQSFDPWLALLAEAEQAVAGLYSVSQVLAQYVTAQLAAVPSQIVISLGHAGLRQSYFENGKLRFSRLSPLPATHFSESTDLVLAEAAKLHQYLIGQRLITRGQQIPVACLTDSNDFARFHGAVGDTPELAFQLLPLAVLGNQTPAAASDQFLLAQLNRRSPAAQFLPSEARQFYRIWLIRVGLAAATLGTLGLAALTASTLLLRAWGMNNDATPIQQSIQLSRAQQKALFANLPATLASPENLRSLLDATRAIGQQMPAEREILQRVSHALERMPAITLQDLRWQLTQTAAEQINSAAAPGLNARLVVVDITATLPESMIQDKRTQSETIERFAAQLKAAATPTKDGNSTPDPRTDTRITLRPFETDSSKSLRANAAESAQALSLKFGVRLWYPLTPDLAGQPGGQQ